MAEQVKLWHVEEGGVLQECEAAALDLEERLETWIEQDATVLSPDLLVIDRQTQTDFGGAIDLLCLNRNGDVIVVELKKGKTPREVAAQALEYASWVRGLSNERISAIADQHLGEGLSLEDSFVKKFGTELPDVLNESHSILIVGSEIDATTERIVNYLSDDYGVNINAATFQFFRTPHGDELLARVFLIVPERLELQSRTRSSSKRRRTLTLDELEGIAEKNGVSNLYGYFVDRLNKYFKRHTTKSSVVFTEDFDGSRKAVFSLIPPKSSSEDGLHFQVYMQRFCLKFSIDVDEGKALLPENREEWRYYEGAGPDWEGFVGYFKSMGEVEHFLRGLDAASAQMATR